MTKSTTTSATSSETPTSTPSGSKPESSSKSSALQNEDSPIGHDLAMEKAAMRRSKGRENVRDKAKRLLVSGRLRVVKVDGDVVVAECRGDSGGVYHLGHDPDKAPHWRCTCEARTACSHLHALWAVTAVER